MCFQPNDRIADLPSRIRSFPKNCTFCVDNLGRPFPPGNTLLSCNIGASGLFVTFVPAVTALSFSFYSPRQSNRRHGVSPFIPVVPTLPPDTPIIVVRFVECSQCNNGGVRTAQCTASCVTYCGRQGQKNILRQMPSGFRAG